MTEAIGTPLLEFVNATKQFDGLSAVDSVSFEVPRGQFVVVLGPSGAGKSTLLRMVNGLETPSDGAIRFDGRPVNDGSLPEVRPRIAMVHQQFNLTPRLSVLKNVLTGALPRVSTIRSLLGLFPKSRQQRACHLLQRVGLTEHQLYQPAGQLSGGEQQRVAIARAFILRPELVLADEPVASLDPETSRTILQLLRTAAAEEETTVLCSLHQVDLAQEFADRIIGMRNGRVVLDQAPGTFADSDLETIYGTNS